MAAVISFFFRLRVFDELKDYELDLQNHPQRVLQSGRITLRKLFRISLGGSVLEAAWSGTYGLAGSAVLDGCRGLQPADAF